MKIDGQTVGSSQLNRRDDVKLEQQLGSQQGYAHLEDALKIAELNAGADAILQGPDQRFYPIKLDQNLQYGNGPRDYMMKRDQVNISGQNFKVVCLVDRQNQVLIQADGDSRLESLASSSKIRTNLSRHLNSANAVAFPEKALQQAGAPDWKDKVWPKGEVAVARKDQVIKEFTAMALQQFRYEHGRNPSFEELPSALIRVAPNLPYQPTSTLEGAARTGNDALASWDRSRQNTTEHFLRTGSGRCGDVSAFLYESLMAGAKTLGFEQQARDRVVMIGATGDGYNVNHGAIGLLPPGQRLSKAIKPEQIKIYDLWDHKPNPQPIVQWAEDYCFRKPMSATKNLLTPGAGNGGYNLDIFYPADHPYSSGKAPSGVRDYLVQRRNFNNVDDAHWEY